MKRFENINILIVDDRPANLISLRALLENFEVNIVEATSGNEALSYTLSMDFALVLLDVQMPEMDGYETAELMRGSSRTRNVPIIFVTAINKEDKHIFKGYEAGAVDYLAKPLDPHILRSKVKVFVELYLQKQELKKQNEALREANETIISQQKSVIEEERLKVLLHMSGATAHEINQPLFALLGHMELLEEKIHAEEAIEWHLEEIKKAGKRIRGIVQNFQRIGHHDVQFENNSSFVGKFEQHLNVLSIEDDDDDYFRLEKVLINSENITLSRANNIQFALSMIKEGSYDIVLLDYLLPDGTGFDYITKSAQEGISVPFAVITGHGDEIVASKMIQAGALDYLPKDKLNPSSLIRTIYNIYEKARLIKEIKKKNSQLKVMASEDELTGTYNRRYFNKSLASEFERAKRYDQEMILLMMDLDNFKVINDTYGHPVGDIVLTRLGKELLEITRKNDVVCRFGGEEFSVVLPNAYHKKGYEVAEKIRIKFSEIIFSSDSYRFSMTISIGCASSHDADSPEQLLVFADQALYNAKQSGRNQVVVYS